MPNRTNQLEQHEWCKRKISQVTTATDEMRWEKLTQKILSEIAAALKIHQHVQELLAAEEMVDMENSPERLEW